MGELRVIPMGNVTCGTDIVDMFDKGGPLVVILGERLLEEFPVY